MLFKYLQVPVNWMLFKYLPVSWKCLSPKQDSFIPELEIYSCIKYTVQNLHII